MESNLVPHLGHSVVFFCSICSRFSTFALEVDFLMNFKINDNDIEVVAIVIPKIIDLNINVGKSALKYDSE
jgi:hypothetical protein